ncbi:hypothetical protein HanRHA438_Chr17g0802121 [Helianthus annuus]|nr:hypothetical protein HanRHA438_Chr17g0802121 [Helianthus annuus]
MVKDSKGNEKHSSMHENRAIRQQFLHYSKLSTGRVHPTRPRAAHSAANRPIQVTGHGAVFIEHAPVPMLLLLFLNFCRWHLNTGPCSVPTGPCPDCQ